MTLDGVRRSTILSGDGIKTNHALSENTVQRLIDTDGDEAVKGIARVCAGQPSGCRQREDHPLFFKDNTRMLFGDAKESIDKLVGGLRG